MTNIIFEDYNRLPAKSKPDLVWNPLNFQLISEKISLTLTTWDGIGTPTPSPDQEKYFLLKKPKLHNSICKLSKYELLTPSERGERSIPGFFVQKKTGGGNWIVPYPLSESKTHKLSSPAAGVLNVLTPFLNVSAHFDDYILPNGPLMWVAYLSE